MFEHSVKVPRQYKVAANIFKTVSTEGGSVKTLLYDNKLKHFRTNVLYALITETIKHAADIDKIFASCGILQNEPRLDPWLSKVLTAELLFGKKSFPGKSKPEQIILSYKEQFEKYTTEHQDDLKTEVVRRPRYVRINTNLLTTSDAIGAFQDEGYRFIRCTSGSYDDYLKQIQGLSEYDFTQDYHVKTVFVFSAGTKLHEHDLYLENKIILQDKATTMAVHLLAPPNGSVVLDLCAAPGMKTTQAAAYMRNEGKIYAIERNEQRYQTLCDFVEKTGSKCVQTLHKDALDIKRGDFDDVEYIILDPSCSGSGMELCVHNYIEDTRLAKLTSLQEKFLKHAMNAFPKAKRIVYSTCSLFPEENERVVVNTVKTSRAKWRVQDVKELLKGQWNSMGSGMYGSIGTRCMYARPGDDMTTGFFLAVLDRDPKDLEKSLKNEGVVDGKVKNKREKHEMKDKGVEETMDDDGEVVIEKAHKKKKKKDRDVSEIDAENDVNGIKEENEEETDLVESEIGKKKKKHKKKRKEIDDSSLESQEGNVSETKELQISEEKVKKRKKKSKNKEVIEIPEMDSEMIENSEELSRKKKKHKSDDAEADSQELEQPVKKKKKHEKNALEITENEIDVGTETVKKKKKKRDKGLES